MGSGIRTLRRFAFIILFVLASCTAAVAIVWHFHTAAEIFPEERLTCEGDVRSYRLVVPHALPQPAPIVFAFHGVGGSGQGMARYSKFDRLAGNKGFLLVYPAAQKGMWATMETEERPLDENPDIQFFDQLLEHLGKRFDIDRNRIYIVGMSNGASFVQLLTVARPSVIAAAAAHSGPKPREFEPDGKPPPLLLVVGEDDFAFSAMRTTRPNTALQGASWSSSLSPVWAINGPRLTVRTSGVFFRSTRSAPHREAPDRCRPDLQPPPEKAAQAAT